MIPTDPDEFLAAVPLIAEFEGVAELDRYRPLPQGWVLAIADIIDSTEAIRGGHYKAVNMAGAAVITCVLNALGRHDLPFVFGGDGGLVALPGEGAGAARAALARLASWAREELGLEMRVALVPVAEIRGAGLDVRVARFQASDQVTYAMFAGGGGAWAEAQMKAGRFLVPPAPAGSRPDLTGLSCRWGEIGARRGLILSMIVLPPEDGADAAFATLLAEIIALAGTEEREGHPVPPGGPPLRFSLAGIAVERRVRRGILQRLMTSLSAGAASILIILLHVSGRPLGRFDARRYARDVSLNTDFRKFDDGLKMTLDIDPERLSRIEARLEAAARAGQCRYGLHRQEAALMTCVVPTPLSRDHMHFVDGAAGGYAAAARRLKDGAGAGAGAGAEVEAGREA